MNFIKYQMIIRNTINKFLQTEYDTPYNGASKLVFKTNLVTYEKRSLCYLVRDQNILLVMDGSDKIVPLCNKAKSLRTQIEKRAKDLGLIVIKMSDIELDPKWSNWLSNVVNTINKKG